jgi:uncharacterized integral membrane protein
MGEGLSGEGAGKCDSENTASHNPDIEAQRSTKMYIGLGTLVLIIILLLIFA